ncbi:hypothetical protein [Sedimentitalea todarodis]|uniref:Uncharacterized protein n=1 Tax=Sedimentitalea todarodis TaxID=1631240 RepID=A0ABU3VBY2_9RHOB|nr:hypothetical protein [Sedimentitalea todarodis]MDU9003681.1 hypothetical protein [Sedimentitalea todarodis]
MSIKTALALVLLPASLCAQEPLSVIEWLGQHPPDAANPVHLEPPVVQSARQPEIEVSILAAAAIAVGLVPNDVTGLPLDLWAGSDVNNLARLIADVPVARSPAMQTLLYTLLLTDALPPDGETAAEMLLLARIDRLLALGATDPAQSLAEQADPTNSAALFQRWFDATLLTGDEDRGCAALAQAPHLSPRYATRIFCDARRGDWQTAALTLETAHALELLPPEQLDLLDRFLSPDIFEGAPPLPAPADPDPLTFRLFETIGERLPTASLPRAFATADLRDIAGWKAQIEAAERLSSIGALAPNQLLGLYTAQRPSASGGVWDRVSALQKFDNAVLARDAAAVTQTLPRAWRAMRDANLAVPFAQLFADDLAKVALTDPETRDLAWRIRLLSSSYKIAGAALPKDDADSRFLAALASGEPTRVAPPNDIAAAIAEAFELPATSTGPDLPPLGEALLIAIRDFDSGTDGNIANLTQALASLRAFGLEETARQAALQLMLLGET